MTPASNDNYPLSNAVTLQVPLARVGQRRLALQYRVANGLSEPIYLVNGVYIWTGQGLSVDANLIYTEVVEDRLRLTKAFIDIPRGVRAEAAEVPYLSQVAAGSAVVEALELPLPLEPFHPYSLITRQDGIHLFEQVELAVGWLPAAAVETRQVDGTDDRRLSAADYRQVGRAQRLLVVALPVKVPARFGRAG